MIKLRRSDISADFFVKKYFHRLFLRQWCDIIKKIALELMQGEKDV